MTIPFHPLADIFPLMEGEGFDALVASIKANGLREPIVIFEDMILDGRNRDRACAAAGVDPVFVPFRGNNPVAFVVDANLHRRHLTESQRAMVAAKLATLKQGARTDLSPIGEMSQGQAAELLNVGKRSVERAKIVLGEGSAELIQAVQIGKLSVSAAEERIRRGLNTGVAMCPYAERGHDLYETPPGAVHALLAEEVLQGDIWEPASGPGAIVRVLRAVGHRVVATDLIEYGCPDATGGIDFLQQRSAPERVTTILTNPPFKHADEFVRHALTLVPRVIMLLRVLFLETQGRRDVLEGGRLARVYVFRNRLPIHRDGWEGARDSNPMALAWFVWEREHRARPELRWLSCAATPPTPESVSPDPGEMPPIPDFLRRPLPQERTPSEGRR
jgi:hypothetical protein